MAKSIARGKALVAKLRGTPGVRDAEALAAFAGRTKTLRKAGIPASTARLLALKKGGMKEGGASSSSKSSVADKGRKITGAASAKSVTETPDPSERFNNLGGDITEKQGSFLRSLIDGNSPNVRPNSANGEPEGLSRQDIGNYAILVNLPKPNSKSEASDPIDALKSGGPRGYASKNKEWFGKMAGKLTDKYGTDLSGFDEAAKKRYQSLTTQQKISAQDRAAAYRRLVINPLLKV